ncbi:hypothetical protein [Hydrogenivirga sp. 128-5-R1-1]|uniref:hypothetical protein n=1 Tax=Hydrogenivirga sp. 128-5-R1-1 TaxID=392423 RepID=UPI00015F3AAC|nr:hypothetical protein [Hydrogenivirga sp. 128-5-R1-1]EDP73463.1 hypothetical protein HG1285_10802 [Hydrogenivirga sp. 128-5-R1-1]
MNWKISAKEVGKGFINIGVAFIVFALIQPIINNNLSLKTTLIALVGFSLSVLVGSLLIAFGGKSDDC